MLDFSIDLYEPDWVQCPRCSREINRLEASGQCWTCDRDDAHSRALRAAEARAGLRAAHDWIRTDNPDVWAMFGAPSQRSLEARITRLVHQRRTCNVLTISGPTGAGKTTLAVLLARQRVHSALVITAHALAEACARRRLGSEDDTLRAARTVSLLVVDELRVPSLPSAKDAIENLVWERCADGTLTVITHGFGNDKDPGGQATIERDWGTGMHRRMYVDGEHVALPGRAKAKGAAA